MIKWGVSSRWLSSLPLVEFGQMFIVVNCPMRNSDQMSIAKTYLTLGFNVFMSYSLDDVIDMTSEWGESICRLSWKVFADFEGNNARISL